MSPVFCFVVEIQVSAICVSSSCQRLDLFLFLFVAKSRFQPFALLTHAKDSIRSFVVKIQVSAICVNSSCQRLDLFFFYKTLFDPDHAFLDCKLLSPAMIFELLLQKAHIFRRSPSVEDPVLDFSLRLCLIGFLFDYVRYIVP